MGWDGDADVVVAQEEAAVSAGNRATRIQKPRLRSGGIHVEELEELFLQVPEAQEAILGDAQGAEVHERLEEGEVGVGIAGAVNGREFETVLQPGDQNSRPVQRFGYVGEGVGGCAQG